MNICAAALADRPDTLVVVKAHPNHRGGAMPVPVGAAARFVQSDRNLNELQAAADVMIGAMGTSDAEALAIGCPIVRVALSYFDLSPTSDVPGAGEDVATAGELRAAIESIFVGLPRPEPAQALIERAFFRLDGHAGDRVLAALASA